jgi:hypothetical protein
MTVHSRHERPDELLIPSFAKIFFAKDGGRCPASELITPRNAADLWSTAIKLADVLDAQLGDIEARIPLSHSEWGRLPWVVTDASVEWFGRFVDAVLDLADDAASGRCPVPRCTGEEMALHLVLEDISDSYDPALRRLAETARSGLPLLDWDGNWDAVACALFPSPQVRALIADGFDGISDDYELVAETGIVRLAVERWFDPYDEFDPVRPLPICGCPVPP